MALETGNYVGDLVATNPTSSDGKSQGDDHIRLVKACILQSFTGFAGAICVTGTDGGAVNAYTLTPSTALLAYGTKMIAVFAPTITNTGAATLNISGLGAKNIKSVSGDALTSGELVAGQIYTAIYNGTEFRLDNLTKQYVDQLAMSAALPLQTGSSGKVLTTDGTNASWTGDIKTGTIRLVDSTDTTKKAAFDASGFTTATTRTVALPDKSGTMAMTSDVALVLLATLTPTAAAALDLLSVFSSTYDNYLIVLDQITASGAASVQLRFATGGTVDAGANYFSMDVGVAGSATTSTAVNQFALTTTIVNTSTQGTNVNFYVTNANSTSGIKGLFSQSITQSNTTPTYTANLFSGAYVAANAISGFRLILGSGGNFGATGKVRVYGIQNS